MKCFIYIPSQCHYNQTLNELLFNFANSTQLKWADFDDVFYGL